MLSASVATTKCGRPYAPAPICATTALATPPPLAPHVLLYGVRLINPFMNPDYVASRRVGLGQHHPRAQRQGTFSLVVAEKKLCWAHRFTLVHVRSALVARASVLAPTALLLCSSCLGFPRV